LHWPGALAATETSPGLTKIGGLFGSAKHRSVWLGGFTIGSFAPTIALKSYIGCGIEEKWIFAFAIAVIPWF